ncbi:MAG: hypothetical protein LQ350_008504 [Teloschistes chrysophthalmus]|nr:MAG: hypothetical protein LQ350_008504 [Niorma chrysophthalma]
MSSAATSEASQSDDDVGISQRARMDSTPRTPLYPEDVFPSIGETKAHRSNSIVRFQDLEDVLEESDRLNTMKRPPRSPLVSPTSVHEDDTRRLSLQLQSQLFDKIETLENQLRNLEISKHLGSSERGDESSERTGLSTEIQWMTWQEYLEDASKASNILEVLVEKPHTNGRRRSVVAPMPAEVPQRLLAKASGSQCKNIERIRIRSFHIINALQIITEQTFSSSSRLIIHRPFKVLLFYHEQIVEYLAEMEHDFAENTQCPLGKQCKGFVDLGDSDANPDYYKNKRRSFHRRSFEQPNSQTQDGVPSTELTDNECRHEESEELLAQAEAIIHLRILVKFMKEDMQEIFAKHELLRSSQAEMVAFQDMWHLFMAGDLVVSESDSSDRGLELYQVAILPACDFFSSRRPVKQIQTKTEGSHQLVESVYREESVSAMNVFTVDVFYFDFDGQKFGPVEKRLQLVSYEGEKSIVGLPLYPLRFRKDAAEFKDMMLERGRKFQELSIPNVYPHREYNGLSIGEPQEQIDSQVIIDFALAYRKHPKNTPKFGLRSWIEDDARIVTEACGVPGCTDCFKDRFMFDDHRVDRQRTVEYIRAHGSLLRIFSSGEELTEEMMLLLPNKVYGFVLRSRRWHFLNIDNVRALERHSDGFENLVLPPGVARLVESLVKTHDPQTMPTFSGGGGCEQDHHVDLVRGKGKGLVILLHGAPGVGKTSTAECVADYTHRPLFPITCGDIGETSKEVEYNLEQNFSLAHRWGCVLLLDEADVFLQARDRENMRRNSVVSVFLRVLEFYSGILFLTTNKVGHFDEAFKSRIHVKLYYPVLDKRATLKIWKMNLDRLDRSKKSMDVETDEIYEYARNHYRELHRKGKTTWNGRQIKNAFQTAIALAEFDANQRHRGGGSKPILALEHFKVVAQAAEDFDDYLYGLHGGTEGDLAKRYMQRDDEPMDGRGYVPGGGGGGGGGSKSKKRHESSTSSESEESEEEDVKQSKRRRKERKGRKKGKKGKKVSSSESEEESEGDE